MTILSIVTASLLIVGCGASEKEKVEIKPAEKGAITKSVEDMNMLAYGRGTIDTHQAESKSHSESKSEKTEAPSKNSIEQKISSIGENKTVGEIITASIAGAGVTQTVKSDKKTETASAKPFDYKLKPKKVTDNVWCFFGAIEKPTKENAGNMANNCYIKTNDGYLVMDTGPSYQFALQAYDAMQKIEELPVKYVVNSHEHDDHWLGNDFYKKKFGATLIGPDSINKNYKDGDKTRMYNVLPQNAIEGTHIIKLDKVPTEPYTLTFGGEEFRIIPMDVKAHTGDDVFIYMPKRKVLFSGDLVMNGRITSGRHGSVLGQLKALAMMQKLDWKVLVPGHGFITDAKAMDEASLYFKLTKERILKAIDEGVDATEINEVVKLIEFKDKAMYDILNAHNVGFAFEELEMWEGEEEAPQDEEKSESATTPVTEVKKVESKIAEVPAVPEVPKAVIIQKVISTDKKSIGEVIKTVAETKVEVKEEAKAETKVEVKEEAKAETKVEVKEEAKAETKVEVKEESKAETKVEVKEEAKSETKAEVKEITVPTKSADAFDYKLKPTQVSTNVWCFFGAIEPPTKKNAGNMANNCYIKTKDSYVVMDTGPSYQFALQAYDAMSKIEKLPVSHVVISHEHDDHWLGNDFYKKTFGAKLIGPESVNREYKEGIPTRMFNILPKNAIAGTHIIKLDETPKEKYSITIGGEVFDIIPMDVKAHTGDDIFVYMPKRRVLFAGDLIMNGRITSGRHGSVMGQLKALDMIDELNWQILIPGHGFITDAKAMDEARLYFTLTRDRILEAIENDVDATTINEVVKLKEFKDKAMYDILNAHNVGFAFDELEMLE